MVPNYRRGRFFGRAINYVLTDKADPSKPRGGARILGMANVTSVETAGVEMAAFARLSSRCRRAMIHWTFSLAPGEHLPDAELAKITREIRADVFGLDDTHQSFTVVHDVVSERDVQRADRHARRFPEAAKPHHGCLHVHDVANAISTATGRTADDHWDSQINLRLQAKCRELEKRYGLKELRGYIPKDEMAEDREPRYRDLGKPSTGQVTREMRTGTRPLIDDQDIITPALERSSWDETAAALADIGIVLLPAGKDKAGHTKGLTLADAHSPDRRAKLSQFLKHGAKTLEARFNESYDDWIARASVMPTPAKMIDRDPERTTLLRQFEVAKRAHKQRNDGWALERRNLTARHARQKMALNASLAADIPSAADETRIQLLLTQASACERKRIENLRRLYRQLRARQRCEALAATQKAERAALKARRPGRQPAWASWLKEQASLGIEAAARVLERLTHRLAQRNLVEAITEPAAPPVEHSLVLAPAPEARRAPAPRSLRPPVPAPQEPTLSEWQKRDYDRRNEQWSRERK